MTRTRPSTHLRHRHGAACGSQTQTALTNTTTQLHQVTCGRCIRSIHMADAEAKAVIERRRKDTP